MSDEHDSGPRSPFTATPAADENKRAAGGRPSTPPLPASPPRRNAVRWSPPRSPSQERAVWSPSPPRPRTPPLPVPSDLDMYGRPRGEDYGNAPPSLVTAPAALDLLFSPNSPTSRPATPPLPLPSRSPSPPYGHNNGEGSRTARTKKSSTPPPAPVLHPELPLAWDDARGTFETLERCVYERKDLGQSREADEMMVCDCVYDPDDPEGSACGVDSDCINRAIFIECLGGECRAGKHCRNQRLSKRQYAPVDVVQTEKKGFGLRAREPIPSGSLIYEYIGEVVVEKTFRKRMALYADEGIKHFYFMMLQKEEYLDATKKGGIGRFANHSCNPNCEVQKWVVGRRIRMGIFTKRDVLKDEEITFNYNVDRYGHEAQICYCGEPNCVGTIGGKTQTDIGGMDDLFLDALGIMDEVSAGGMKGSRKKKARQLAEDDYNPELRPIEEPLAATKVAAAVRQSMENPRMMTLLLRRVKMSEDPVVQRQLMRMHGFSLMTMVLTDMSQNRDIVALALEGLANWKVAHRNKIEDSNIEEVIKPLRDGPDSELAGLAAQLLESWKSLEMSYRIPRVSKIASLDDDDARDTTTIAEAEEFVTRHVRMADELANTDSIHIDLAPIRRGPPAPLIRHRPPPPLPPPRPAMQTHTSDRSKLDAIIAMAQQAPLSVPASASTPGSHSRGESSSEPRKRQKTTHRPTTAEEAAKKEKRLTKLVGEVVVRSMSKYKDQMEHETFKRYAKECTALLVDKEMRGHSYAAHRNPSLSDDKKAKIKVFTKEYAHKLLRNLKAKGKLKRVGGSANGHAPGSASASSSAIPAAGGSTSSPAMSTPSATPGRALLTPGATPSMYTSTPSGSGSHGQGTPNGGGSSSALLDDIFGEDDPLDEHEHDDYDDEMDIDGSHGTPGAQGTPSASVSVSGADHTPAPTTPPLPPSPLAGGGGKAIVVEHAAGPFGKDDRGSGSNGNGNGNGPILVDRVQNLRFETRRE